MYVYIYLYLSINIYCIIYANIYTYVHILYAYIQSEQLSDTECMTANMMCRPFDKSFAPSAFVCASTSTQISNTQTYIYQ
jgi:hypothetical protein